jgi:hypothetical protein
VDIAPDDSFLLIAEANTGLGRGIVHKLDLSSGIVTQLAYPTERVSYENGTWDIAIGSNGIAMFTTVLGVSGYSGQVPLRQLDLTTLGITIRADAPGSYFNMVEGNTIIDRSADRTRLLLREPDNSNGPIFTYDATTKDAFGPVFKNHNFNELVNSAVNRDGSLMSLRYKTDSVIDRLLDFGFGHRWTGVFDSGVAFSAVEDILYAIKSSTDQIIAYDTNTFAEKFRVAIGEDVPATPHESQNPGDPSGEVQFSVGTLVASQEGRYLALIAPTSIRVIDLATRTSTPVSAMTRVSAPISLANISTRTAVGDADNATIAGFIITGSAPVKILVRGMGPTLGVPGTLTDPFLELHKPDQTIITNDNWGDSDTSQIPAGFAPGSDKESVIVATLDPGNYTAILKGAHGETGVGLAEVYNLDSGAPAKMANISTRGFVQTGDNVMIGGFILGGSRGLSKVVVRAIGPSLTQSFGIGNALSDPTLELRDKNGALLASNDNWRVNAQTGQSQEAQVRATTVQPTDDLESAIVATLPGGAYTAIVAGKDGGTGVALVEVYNLQ